MDFEDFFAGESDDFAPFETPAEIASPSPTLGWLGILEYTPDDSSLRLRQFAYEMSYFVRGRTEPAPNLDESNRALQGALLRRASAGRADGSLAAEDFGLLWRTLLEVVRADRFNEGVVAVHAGALARIANELRLRLVAERRRTRLGPSSGT